MKGVEPAAEGQPYRRVEPRSGEQHPRADDLEAVEAVALQEPLHHWASSNAERELWSSHSTRKRRLKSSYSSFTSVCSKWSASRVSAFSCVSRSEGAGRGDRQDSAGLPVDLARLPSPVHELVVEHG